MTVDEVIQRLCTAYGVADATGLAARLQMDETTFRVWRTRKKVPSKILAQCSLETGRSVGWLAGELAAEQVQSGLPDYMAAEPEPAGSKKFHETEKQINLTPEERALLDNYRASSADGRRVLEAAGAAMAKHGRMKVKRA